MSIEYGGCCCQDITLALTSEEAARLRDAGSVLGVVLPPPEEGDPIWNSPEGVDSIGRQVLTAKSTGDQAAIVDLLTIGGMLHTMLPEEGLFSMEGPCGNLGLNGACEDYTNRPSICRRFEVGKSACRALQKDELLRRQSVSSEVFVSIR